MQRRHCTILAVALLCLAPVASLADLAPYTQDFEGLTPAPQPEFPFESSLADTGWLFFGNVFNPDFSYRYGYGPFLAPNHGEAVSAVVGGEGGPGQGDQQLSVFSDYRNGDHQFGRWIETNVFQEQVIGAIDVGTSWIFTFDAKRGNIGGATTARAWFKTLNPAAGYALTNFIWVDMTNVSPEWGSYSVSIDIDPTLVGQILQFGFLNTATFYEGSGMLYDNVEFSRKVDLDIKPGSCPNPINARSKGVTPAAVLGTMDFDVKDIDPDSLRLEGVAPFRSNYEDVSTPYGGDLCGCTTAGPDGDLDLTLKFWTQDLVNAIGAPLTGDKKLTLTGMLLDGTPIKAEDCVVFVGGRQSSPFDTGVGGDMGRTDLDSKSSDVGTVNPRSTDETRDDDAETRTLKRTRRERR